MKITISISNNEIAAAQSIAGSLDIVSESIGNNLGLKEKFLVAIGKEVTHKLDENVSLTFSKTTGLSIVYDYPEEMIITVLDLYADLIVDISMIAIPTVASIKLLVSKYKARIESIEAY